MAGAQVLKIKRFVTLARGKTGENSKLLMLNIWLRKIKLILKMGSWVQNISYERIEIKITMAVL
jgi:hypothetical protein